MKAGKLNLIVSIAFLSIPIVLINSLQIKSVYADAGGSAADQIIELLQTGRILTLGERNKLSKLVNGLASAEKRLSVLQELSLRIVQKVDNDTYELQYLLLNLEKLANSEYARTIGDVKRSDLKNCRDILEKLERNIEASRPRFPKPQKYRDAEYYLRMIKDNSALLTGGANSVTVFDLWESIRKTVKPAYLPWNKEYIVLVAELKKHQKDFYSPSDFLTYQEMRFIEMFGLVQSQLRKLSESNSRDF